MLSQIGNVLSSIRGIFVQAIFLGQRQMKQYLHSSSSVRYWLHWDYHKITSNSRKFDEGLISPIRKLPGDR